MTQAYYHPENFGHFGLALRNYAHFTSPIRRYSDLIVHRALIAGHGWGEDGLSARDIEKLEETAKLISDAERRSMVAERDTTDRYLAAYLSDRVGAEFAGRISGVQRFGLFVKLDETGADGLIPIRVDRARVLPLSTPGSQTLMGAETGMVLGVGQRVTVRLAEAVPVTGGLMLDLLEIEGEHAAGGAGASAGAMRRASRGRRGADAKLAQGGAPAQVTPGRWRCLRRSLRRDPRSCARYPGACKTQEIRRTGCGERGGRMADAAGAGAVAVSGWRRLRSGDRDGCAGRCGDGEGRGDGDRDAKRRFEAWVAGFRARALAAGITPATFDAAFAGCSFDPEVVEKDRNQNEFTKTIWDYLDTRRVGGPGGDGQDGAARASARCWSGSRRPMAWTRRSWWRSGAWKAPMARYRGDFPLIGSLATLAYDGRRGGVLRGGADRGAEDRAGGRCRRRRR